MTTYSAQYDPTPGFCACGEQLPSVRAVLDEKPVCESCLEASDWEGLYGFLDALDTIDTYLARSNDDNRQWLLHDAERLLRQIGRRRVPLGHEEGMPDEVFAEAVIERVVAAGQPVQYGMSVIGSLAPEMTVADCRELARKLHERNLARAAKAHADAEQAAVYVRLYERVPDAESFGEVVDRLNLDIDRFFGAIQVAAAQAGVSIADLPASTIDELLASCKWDGAK